VAVVVAVAVADYKSLEPVAVAVAVVVAVAVAVAVAEAVAEAEDFPAAFPPESKGLGEPHVPPRESATLSFVTIKPLLTAQTN